MQIDFVTLFPEMILPYVQGSILGRAERSRRVGFGTQNPRDFAEGKHRKVDDSPYGGGPGMVMMAPPIAAAVEACNPDPDGAIVLADPAAPLFTQEDAESLAVLPHLVFICGHYEGVDERVRTQIATHTFSIGSFVMTGGELAALAMADAVVRLQPGVLGSEESHADDSFTNDGLLGFPLYTRPAEFRGESVPPELLSGNHAEIARWRRRAQIERTKLMRPDLFDRARLKKSDHELL